MKEGPQRKKVKRIGTGKRKGERDKGMQAGRQVGM